MKSITKNIIYIITALLCCNSFSYAQESHSHSAENHSHNSHYFFKQNKGQWHENVLFKANLPDGAMFLENSGITYSFTDKTYIRSLHNSKKKLKIPESIKGHVVRVKFKGANENPIISQKRMSTHYENYFIGNDKSKWASNVRVYNEVNYKDVYDGIDFKIYEKDENLKYDFIVAPHANPKKIKMVYNGADELTIKNGVLYVKTTITDIIENKPFAYQIINNKRVEVACKFKLKNKTVRFVFPKAYNKDYELVIDPFLVFGSYTNSTSDNFGFTATYDTLGNLYGAGIVFGNGYPTTTGAYDRTWAGGTSFPQPVDIAISKFNATGSSLLYSTYLGGTGGEAPHSLVVNDAGELYVFGTTGSSNFPRTTGCYDNTFGGGTNINPNGSGVRYTAGCDIFVAKFNAAGSSLLGSTFVGGTGNDGINITPGMKYNYGDEFRGEIILDNSGNCYVASATNSTNFPTSTGKLTSSGGASDAIVFKLNSNLTSMVWSTHFGGTAGDAAYGLQRDGAGNVFVTGGTKSTNIDLKSNTLNGGVDGFLAKFNSAGTLLTSRYIGTSSYDQSYFVQVDISDDVYVFGQSKGAMTVTTGKYRNLGSHQFIQKFNNTLTSLTYGTVIGTGGSSTDISPSAFLVNDCGLIYLSGWGGSVNFGRGGGYTTGLPVSTGAFQTTTTGSDFYLMVLTKDALALHYATFFGGTSSAEHVDGGTSRFDKKGNVYQAVCAGCGGRNDFPTNVGAWSRTNGSSNCNLGVFKFNIDEIKAVASIPSVIICYPNAAIFSNTSSGGNTYHWSFGDGTFSSAFAPTHFYSAAGTYTVVLTVSDSTGCLAPDTSSVIITVYNPSQVVATNDTIICPNTSVQLNATGSTSYLWSPAATLNNPNIATPIASPTVNTRYRVIATDPCGKDTSYVWVRIHTVSTTTSNDTTICLGDSAYLSATGGGTYSWTPNSSLINSTTSNPIAFPTVTTKYYTNIVTADGCPAIDSVRVLVNTVPNPILSPNISICQGKSTVLTASGATSYSWTPGAGLSSTTSPSVTASPNKTTTYTVTFTNMCGKLFDSVTVSVLKPIAVSSPDDTICFNVFAKIRASGGVNYSWSPSSYATTPNSDTTLVNPPVPTRFRVIVSDAIGCKDTAYTHIAFSPIPTVNAGIDKVITFGESVEIKATHSKGSFTWIPHASIGCYTCEKNMVTPGSTIIYTAKLTDKYGCIVTDDVLVSLDGALYIPNTFSPNGDSKNDVFKISAQDILEFEILIFNRWGELIYESEDINEVWDGSYKGKQSQIGTYIWKIKYSDVNTRNKEVIGHVNLIR